MLPQGPQGPEPGGVSLAMTWEASQLQAQLSASARSAFKKFASASDGAASTKGPAATSGDGSAGSGGKCSERRDQKGKVAEDCCWVSSATVGGLRKACARLASEASTAPPLAAASHVATATHMSGIEYVERASNNTAM